MEMPVALLAILLVICHPPAHTPTSTHGAGNLRESIADQAPTVQKWKLSLSAGPDETYQIMVADSQGRVLQVLEGPATEDALDPTQLVRLEDFNGDGNPDILARGLSAGASALTSESIYVYDPAAQRFMDAQVFEHEGEVSKTRQGCIAVQYRNVDNMTYAKDHYCWKGGAWAFEGSTK